MFFAVGIFYGTLYQGDTGQNVKLSGEITNYEDLIKKSSNVVTGTVISDNNEFVYDEITFAITEVKVNDWIRGKEQLDTIKILQTKSEDDSYLIKGKEVLLFLDKYEGPITENAYVIKGLNIGQFEIKGTSVYGVATNSNVRASSLNLTDIEADVEKAELKVTIPIKKSSRQSVEDENNHEKQLEKEFDEKKNKN